MSNLPTRFHNCIPGRSLSSGLLNLDNDGMIYLYIYKESNTLMAVEDQVLTHRRNRTCDIRAQPQSSLRRDWWLYTTLTTKPSDNHQGEQPFLCQNGIREVGVGLPYVDWETRRGRDGCLRWMEIVDVGWRM